MSRARHREASTRQHRVGEEIRHALARILAEGKLRDPGLAGRSVTVSEVRMSPDLRTAVVFVAPFADPDAEGLIAALGRARPYLRQRLAAAVKLRYAPDLRFEADRTFDRAERIDALLRRGARETNDGEA
jgi:ribosome-binding factor A